MFVKLFTQILDSSIADNRRLRHFFTDLLLCSDPSGVVMMTPNALAARLRCPVEEVTWGIEELLLPDPLSKTPDNGGRRIERLEGCGYGWKILNYELYRGLRDADQMREASRLRVQRYRAKRSGNSGNTDGNGCNAITEAEAEAEAEAELNPLPPKGGKAGETDASQESKRGKTLPTSDQAKAVADIARRRHTTAWSDKEIRAFKKLGVLDPDDLRTMGVYYTAVGPPDRDKNHLRHDLLTILNNWPGEVDRALRWVEQNSGTVFSSPVTGLTRVPKH